MSMSLKSMSPHHDRDPLGSRPNTTSRSGADRSHPSPAFDAFEAALSELRCTRLQRAKPMIGIVTPAAAVARLDAAAASAAH